MMTRLPVKPHPVAILVALMQAAVAMGRQGGETIDFRPGCTVVDLNLGGRLDVVCIGTATANLKWYEAR